MSAQPSSAEHEVAERLQDRVRGLLLGLALGDALAAPVQFRRAGTFSRVADLLGGGPYDLPRGAWSDDAATALLCAAAFADPASSGTEDVLQRWASWRRDGLGSSTGQCLGISAAMAAAVAGGARSGVVADPQAEPLPRVAVMAVVALLDSEAAGDLAVALARLTHPQPDVLKVARRFSGWVVRALEGVPKERLFTPGADTAIDGDGHSVGDPSEGPALLRDAAGRGDALSVLRLSRWALLSTASYKEAVLTVINAAGHADVTGATVGALAGAVYGARSLPAHWLQCLYGREQIEQLADQLLVTALTRLLESPDRVPA